MQDSSVSEVKEHKIVKRILKAVFLHTQF